MSARLTGSSPSSASFALARPTRTRNESSPAVIRRWSRPNIRIRHWKPCLRSTFGLVVYEEHILQISEAFAGLNPSRADVLRRALVKQNWPVVKEIEKEFADRAWAGGHADEKIREVWELVAGFNGYAFCKAHSTAYGVE